MTVIDFDLSLDEQIEQGLAAILEHEDAERRIRQVPPDVCLYDGEMRLQHVVEAEYSGRVDLPEADTGQLEIKHPFDHPVGQWLWDEYGRMTRGEKRNVNITVEYADSRIGGLLEHVELELDEETGDQIITARFQSDYERLKWYTVWANPWLPEWIQFPRIFILPGPIPWVLSVMLDLQIQRERGSTWAMPSDPMDPSQRTDLNQSTWSTVVKPISFMESMAAGHLWGIAASRFKNYHDVAKAMMQDGEITPKVEVYLEGDPPPWPGANLRHGTRVVSFEDNSGRFTGTANGGTIWDGLVHTIEQFTEDFIDSTESLVTDAMIPPEYYEPGYKETHASAPFAIYEDTEDSGLETYRLRKVPSKGIQVITGGHSMPGVVGAPV
ncbi:MAG: hypothetical protein ACI38R_21035 [Rhodococcus sp. (in: high G+C Gram-positive bacteria)]